jgi:hypothetical protein
MLTLQQLTTFHRSLRSKLVLSVYIDGTASDPANQRAWRTQLDNSLKNLREWLEGSTHTERETFERTVYLLEDALKPFNAGFGAPGWVAFITEDMVIVSHTLPVVVPTIAVWSTGPVVAPYVRTLKETRPVIVVMADASKADLYRYQTGTLEKLDTVRSHHVVEPPSHMGAPPRQGFHSGTRGSSGKDAAQKSQLEGRDRMIHETVERVIESASADGFIVVGGIKRVANRIVSQLEELAPSRVLLMPVDIHATTAQVMEAARVGSSTLRAALDSRRLGDITEEARRGGLGALGPDETAQALETMSVRDLFLTHQFLENHASDAENVVRAALAQQASVEEVSDGPAEDLEKVGGVAAGLRFRSRLPNRDTERAGNPTSV